MAKGPVRSEVSRVDPVRLGAENLRFILGLKLRKHRQEKGLSLSDLAARAGISVSYLSEIENGRKHPKPEKLIRLAEALAVPYDELVSLQVAGELDPLKAFLGSEFVREFPFELFGIEPQHLFALVADTPSKSAALFETFLEIGRTYGVQVEHMLFAALRSYQQLRHNYFQEMENAAAAFRAAQGWAKGEKPSDDALRAILEERHGCAVDEESLARHPELHGFRSVFVPGDPPRLLVNARLLPSQKAFIYGREIAYRELGLRERAVTGSWLHVDSFGQVLNNFKASYFAGAILIDEEALVEELSELFARERWDGEALLDCMRRFDATPEMFFYRLSQVVPERFGLADVFFLRFHHATGSDDFRLTKVLNFSHVPVPHGIGLDEHYCRRWPALRLLGDLDSRQWTGRPGDPLVAAQRSRFLNEDAMFFVIAVARPLALTEGMKSCVSFGFLVNDAFREKVRFWGDPDVPELLVNLTCERCPLTPEECQDRVAPPTIYRQEERHQAQARALAELLDPPRSSHSFRDGAPRVPPPSRKD
ncbi:MAG TPA: XRE family transcriptional regulator [Gemmatimonadota bacterium]|nr:XRE family transcriptional regulator [Gemmatimonadota bacterium]